MVDHNNLLSRISVKIDGSDPNAEFDRDLLEVTVENSLHLPDVATLVLHDARLHWIDEPSLALGKTVQVFAKVTRQEKLLFDGEIVEIEPDFDATTQRFVVRAFDRLHRLMRGHHVRSFLNVSDGDLVKKIAQEVGLQAKVGTTAQVYPYVFQNDETNLSFLQQRAAALGYLLYVQGKTLYCEPPHAEDAPIELEWGVHLHEFHPRMTTIGQVDTVMVRGWDPAKKQEIVGQARDGHGGPSVGQGKSGAEVAHTAFHMSTQTLVVERPIRAQAVADRLAQAVADRQAGRFIEAEGTSSGDPALIAGKTVHIKAVGDRFSGTYFVTGTLHAYTSEHGYTTQFSISGHSPSTLVNLLRREEDEGITARGLVIGIVTDNQDPDGAGRVKVKYPWLSSEHASDWARVVTLGGGAQRGIEFLPEVNDEVLVGFEMGDIHYPYVLGGLWNGQDAPPDKVISSGKVQKRIIRSRSGHTITLDDSDGGSGVTLEDKNGNKVVLDSSANKLTVTTQGDITLQTQGNLTLDAQGQTQIKGSKGVKIDAGGATVDVKGSMITLN